MLYHLTVSDEVGGDVICLKAEGLTLVCTLESPVELPKLPILGSTARESDIIGLGCSRGPGSFQRSWGGLNGLPRLRTPGSDWSKGVEESSD